MAVHSEHHPTLLGALHNASAGTKTSCMTPAVGADRESVTEEAEATAINRTAFRGCMRTDDVKKHFTWKENDELASSTFGRIFRGCRRERIEQRVAVKQIARTAIDDVDRLCAEIGILSELDHPNILRFLGSYQDRKNIYVVTELCAGGCLEGWLKTLRGHIVIAARIAREVLGALAHCHAHGVCHRDLRPKNIFLVRNSVESPVRVADFGLAKRCSLRISARRFHWAKSREEASTLRPKSSLSEVSSPLLSSPSEVGDSRSLRTGEHLHMVRLTSFKGTPEYMAPEVIRILEDRMHPGKALAKKIQQGVAGHAAAHYDFRCDVWSLGVVAWILISGVAPYTLEQVAAFVADGAPLPELHAHLPNGKPMPAQSQDFVLQCLRTDFAKRPTSQALLGHPWLASPRNEDDEAPSDSTPSSAERLSSRLQGFAALPRFKRAALIAAVRHLGAYEYEELRTCFQRMDVMNIGSVTAEALSRALAAAPSGAAAEVVRAMDSDGSGEIDFSEFMAAAMDHRIEDRADLAMAAFRGFDLDGDGTISRAELAYVLEGLGGAKVALEQGDRDGDGELSFEEFKGLLKRS